MGDVDCLSRAPLQDPSVEDMDRMFAFVTIETMDLFREGQATDPTISNIKQTLLSGRDYGPFELINGLVYRVQGGTKQLYVPESLRDEVIFEFHDGEVTGGHFGRDKTLSSLIQHSYYWPRMTNHVTNYVRSCDPCAHRNLPRERSAGLMSPIQVCYPWQIVGIDLVGPLAESDGRKYIIVCTEYFTKYVEAAAIADGIAETVARFFVKNVFCRHGAPAVIISDQGRKKSDG